MLPNAQDSAIHGTGSSKFEGFSRLASPTKHVKHDQRTPSEHVSSSFRCHTAQQDPADHVGPKGTSARNAFSKGREGPRSFTCSLTEHPLHVRPTPGQRCAVETWHILPWFLILGPTCKKGSTVGRAKVSPPCNKFQDPEAAKVPLFGLPCPKSHPNNRNIILAKTWHHCLDISRLKNHSKTKICQNLLLKIIEMILFMESITLQISTSEFTPRCTS